MPMTFNVSTGEWEEFTLAPELQGMTPEQIAENFHRQQAHYAKYGNPEIDKLEVDEFGVVHRVFQPAGTRPSADNFLDKYSLALVAGAFGGAAALATAPAAAGAAGATAAGEATLVAGTTTAGTQTVTQWAIQAAQKVATSALTQYVGKLLRGDAPPPAAGPGISINIAPQAQGGRVFDQEGNLDWTRLGDLGLQLLVNNLSPQPSQPAAPQVTQVAFPSLPALGGMAARLIPGMAAAGAAAVGVIRSVGGRIIGWMLPSGQKVTRAAAVALAKNVGLSAAAGALGASVVDLAEAVMQEEGRKRRRTGISAAALTTTTRTMGRIERMHKRIAKAARSHSR